MLNRKTISLLVAVLVVLSALAAASGIARAGESNSSIKLDVHLAENIILDNVVVGEDQSVTFHGHTVEPITTCLPVQVFIDGERGAWWPVFRCVNVDESGTWMVRVPSDDGGSPISIHFQIGK